MFPSSLSTPQDFFHHAQNITLYRCRQLPGRHAPLPALQVFSGAYPCCFLSDRYVSGQSGRLFCHRLLQRLVRERDVAEPSAEALPDRWLLWRFHHFLHLYQRGCLPVARRSVPFLVPLYGRQSLCGFCPFAGGAFLCASVSRMTVVFHPISCVFQKLILFLPKIEDAVWRSQGGRRVRLYK